MALCPWGQTQGAAGEDLGTGVAGAVAAEDEVQGRGAGAVVRGGPAVQPGPFMCWVLGGGGATWGPRAAIG